MADNNTDDNFTGSLICIWRVGKVIVRERCRNIETAFRVGSSVQHFHSDALNALWLSFVCFKGCVAAAVGALQTGDCTCVPVGTSLGHGKSLSGKCLQVLLLFSHWWFAWITARGGEQFSLSPSYFLPLIFLVAMGRCLFFFFCDKVLIYRDSRSSMWWPGPNKKEP